jgi:hypothetical protein
MCICFCLIEMPIVAVIEFIDPHKVSHAATVCIEPSA